MCCKANWQQLCFNWRIWIKPLLILLYISFAIIVVPLLIINSVKDGFTRKDQLILIGGLFVLTAVPISIWHIVQHVVHFTKPILQKHIIRILWMVPIYALNAWLGLLFPEHSIYVDSLRECYEAYVIYNFMVYLLNYLNLGMDLEATLEHKPQVKHFFPLCCMRPWVMGHEFIHNCKHGILQYTVVRPITTFISVICEICGVYGEGSFTANVAFPYIIFVNNISQFVAMYCLVLFYQANKVDLKPMRPIPKFLCIKAVIFFSFFQGVVINFLVYFGYIKNIFGAEEKPNDYKGLSSELQDFLICIEMFIAAIAHIYSFPHEPFHMNAPQYWNVHNNWFDAFLSMIDIRDVQEDVTEHLGVVSSSLSRRIRGRTNYNYVPRGGSGYSENESQYLISSTNNYQSGLNTSDNKDLINNTFTKEIRKNSYGAVDNTLSSASSLMTTTTPNVHTKFNNIVGININKQETNSYSSHLGGGVPASTVNYFQNRKLNTTNKEATTSSKSESNSSVTETSTSKGNVQAIIKSDSNSSDWLSTPTEESMWIDVKGVEKDHIKIHHPKI